MELKEKKNGLIGLFIKKKYLKNEILRQLSGPIKSFPSKNSIQISTHKHIEDEFGIHINHSFNPSCKIQNNKIISLKNLNIGDEITYDYNLNEFKLSHPFKDIETGKNVCGRLIYN
jgi:hypothetical protein